MDQLMNNLIRIENEKIEDSEDKKSSKDLIEAANPLQGV